MWQWAPRGNIQQISYIPLTEQHSPFGLMLLHLGNVTIICVSLYLLAAHYCNTTSNYKNHISLKFSYRLQTCMGQPMMNTASQDTAGILPGNTSME